MKPTISVIIPVYNEAGTIQKTLSKLKPSKYIEVIVVDGGSSDYTVTLAQLFDVRVVRSPIRGRAFQMNTGAAIASGRILLFLHGDTQLPLGYEKMVVETLSKPRVIAGAFELKIEGKLLFLSWVEKMVNWRSRWLSLPYGDQAIFIKASNFKNIDGFPILPIMEDFELIQRLKRKGKIHIIPKPVLTSARRWETLGVIQTTFINQLIILGYKLGVSPTRLAQFYYNTKDNAIKKQRAKGQRKKVSQK